MSEKNGPRSQLVEILEKLQKDPVWKDRFRVAPSRDETPTKDEAK